LGTLLDGFLVCALAIVCASVSKARNGGDRYARFTIGSWVLIFTVAGHPGLHLLGSGTRFKGTDAKKAAFWAG